MQPITFPNTGNSSSFKVNSFWLQPQLALMILVNICYQPCCNCLHPLDKFSFVGSAGDKEASSVLVN